MSSVLSDLNVELRTFISNARDVFHGEPWDQVRNYLERVWFNSGLSQHAAWAEIEARVKSEWETTDGTEKTDGILERIVATGRLDLGADPEAK